MAQNVELTTVGNTLTIVVDLSKTLGDSSSGKSTNIASSGGAIDIPGFPGVKVNMTVYKKK